MSTTNLANQCFKYPDESQPYTFDFSGYDVIAGGDTISSVVSVTATPSTLTVGALSYTTTSVTAVLSGGTAGTQYDVYAIANTTQGNKVAWNGKLFVHVS